MKKTLAIILSVLMLIGAMPFATFAAEPAYDRGKVAANDETYIESMSAEQIASVILDWVDRKIAEYSADIKQDITAGVIANGGFEEFEAILGEDALGNIIADQIPEITSLDGVIAYKDYLKELGGDFANLDASALITREEAGSAIGFIDGVFEFMAANSETFGKVFRWDAEVFDYGKVGEYILSLDPTVEDNKAIIDFYNDYLIGNDIQAKFTKWVADQMNYTIPEDETFDDTLNNGIMAWFSGVCEDMGILSDGALAELRAYDLRTTDIYTLIKNFVALAEEAYKFRVGQCASKIGLSAYLVELGYLIVVIQRKLHSWGIFKQEVCASNHIVKRCVNGSNLVVGRENIPSPDIAIGVGVTIHSVNHVALNIWKKCEVAAIECAALECRVDADSCLVEFFEIGNCLVRRNGVVGIFIQAR